MLLCCSRPWTGRALSKGTRTRSSNLCLVLPSTLLRIFLEKGNSTPATTLWEARKWCRGRARQPAKRPMVGRKADSTLRSSLAVPHPSTNRALRRLTSEVRRDPVHSTRYGRQRQIIFNMYLVLSTWKKDGTHHSEDASFYWQEYSVSSNLGGHCSLLGKILKLQLQRSRHRANVFSHLPAAPHACQHFI